MSHSHLDRSFVNKLVRILRSHGLPYWYSPKHIIGAQQWHDEIGRALARCGWFVVVLSPSSVKSPWVKREPVYALNEKRYKDRIVPLLLRRCQYVKLSWTLQAFQMVDFTRGFDQGCRELLRVWGSDNRAAV